MTRWKVYYTVVRGGQRTRKSTVIDSDKRERFRIGFALFEHVHYVWLGEVAA